MSAPAGGFADNDRAVELLQVVGKLLAAGERGPARQDADRLGLAESAAGHVRQGPGLPEPVVLAFGEAGELDRVMVPQVADDEGRHGGLTAQAAAQVDDEGCGGSDQAHRGTDGLAGDDGRVQDRLQVQVANVARQAADTAYTAAGLLRPPGHGGVLLRVIARLAVTERLVVVQQPQVLVAIDRLQVGGDRIRQPRFVKWVTAVGKPVGQHRRYPRTDVGVDIARFDQRPDFLDHPGHLVWVHVSRQAGPCLSVKSS